MMVGVMSRAVDERLQQVGYTVVSIMYGHSPQVHKHKQEQVRELVQRKQKRVNVVRTALQESVKRMEGMTSKRSRNLPAIKNENAILEPATKCTNNHFEQVTVC